VNCPSLSFSALRVDVSKKEEGQVRARNLVTNAAVKTPFLLTPTHWIQYFEEERTLSLWYMLTNNKMMLVMGFMMLVSWAMKFLADPETLAEMRGKEIAPAPQDILKSYNLPKTSEQAERELAALIAKADKNKPTMVASATAESALDKELKEERRKRFELSAPPQDTRPLTADDIKETTPLVDEHDDDD